MDSSGPLVDGLHVIAVVVIADASSFEDSILGRRSVLLTTVFFLALLASRIKKNWSCVTFSFRDIDLKLSQTFLVFDTFFGRMFVARPALLHNKRHS